jgi:intermediate cleaving peptidase 55
MYVSDITRTFPASGKFTSPQRDLYEVVLTVQKELVKRCRVDEVNMMELQRTSELPSLTRLRSSLDRA